MLKKENKATYERRNTADMKKAEQRIEKPVQGQQGSERTRKIICQSKQK